MSRNVLWFAFLLTSFLVVAGANAHLLYVAFQSQPECVSHSKAAGDGHGFRAAKSAC
jgi:hypothetical protein